MDCGYQYGDKVEVVRGKKFPLGLKGKVFWVGMGNYQKSRAGVEVEGGEKVFIDVGNLQNHDRDAREVVEAAKEEAERLVKKLDWEKAAAMFGKESVISYHQHAYSDESELECPILVDASEAEIVAAIHAIHPRSSSYGQLRWCQGASQISVDREQKKVKFTVSIGICD